VILLINPYRLGLSGGEPAPVEDAPAPLPSTLPFRIGLGDASLITENRVYVGMATPASSANSNPGWTEAQTIIGQDIYEARRFSANSALPVISFKVPGNDWGGVPAGTYNADLLTLFNLAVARRTSGPGGTREPFFCSFHHEPAGDGDLAVWATMQTYCTWYFAGRRGGTASSTYNAAHDVSDIMGWAPCGNGFWWRSMTSPALATDRAAAWPPSLISALNANRGIMLNDFYDADYANQTGALTNESLRVAGTGVRTHTRIENFITWARANGVNASGCGEFGVIDGPELTACWQVMRANRDIWVIANYFNSFANSDHEWRLIPADYPAQNATNSSGLVDFGGDANSAARLAAFKTMLTESVSVTYTGPLP
jgi:hypothetical protein